MIRSLFFIVVALAVLALFVFEPAIYTNIIWPLSGTARDMLWDFRTFVPIAVGIVCLILLKPIKMITGGLISGLICTVVLFFVLCDIAAPTFALDIKIWISGLLGSDLEGELRDRLNRIVGGG